MRARTDAATRDRTIAHVHTQPGNAPFTLAAPACQSPLSSAWRRAIRSSLGPMDDITAANNTTAQPAERIKLTPTSTLAPTVTGAVVVKSWPSAVKNAKDNHSVIPAPAPANAPG